MMEWFGCVLGICVLWAMWGSESFGETLGKIARGFDRARFGKED